MIIIDTGAVIEKATASDVWLIRCFPNVNFYTFQRVNSGKPPNYIGLSDGKFGCKDLGEVVAYARSQGLKGVRGVV